MLPPTVKESFKLTNTANRLRTVSRRVLLQDVCHLISSTMSFEAYTAVKIWIVFWHAALCSQRRLLLMPAIQKNLSPQRKVR
jgi:hypothetical protein